MSKQTVCSRCGKRFLNPLGTVRCSDCIDYFESIRGSRRHLLHVTFWQQNLTGSITPPVVSDTYGGWASAANVDLYRRLA